MADRHRNKKLGFRPSPQELARAKEQLEARGRAMGEFLRACLRAVAEDPDGTLARLDSVWPAPRPTGGAAHGERDAEDDGGAAAGGAAAGGADVHRR